MVELEQATESIRSLHFAHVCVLIARRKEDHVVLALVVPLLVKVLYVLRQCSAELFFAEDHQP
jgi:hypothetical protein